MNFHKINSNREKMKIYFSSLGLCLIMFLWGTQIPIGPAKLPVYLFVVPGLIFLTGLKSKQISFSFTLIFILFGLLVFQVLYQNVQLISFSKTTSGIFVISILIPTIHFWVENSKIYGHMYLIKVMKVLLFLQIILMIFQLVNVSLGFSYIRYAHYLFNFPRASGFFNEPSHIAIGLSPLYFIAINQISWFKKQFGLSSIIILLIILVLSPSASLFAIIILSFIILALSNFRMVGKRILRFIKYTVLLVFIFLLVINYIPDISDRINTLFKFVQMGALTGISNISSLVYIKGYQMAIHALFYYPLGVGFINMEVLNEYSSVSQLNELLFTLNKEDGSSMLFKIISEFGILGLLFFIGSLLRLIKLTRNRGDIFEQAFLFAFVAAAVRGASYFDGSLLIGISLYIFHIRTKFTSLLILAFTAKTIPKRKIILAN